MKPTILVTRNTTSNEMQILEAKYKIIYCPKEKGLIEAISNQADQIRGLITNGKVGLSGKTISLFPNLEIISLSSTGYDTIDIETAKSKKIIVTHGQNTNDDSVADHALALMLALSRDIVAADNASRTDQSEKFQSIFDRNLICGKRLGILGLGTIGKKIAQRAIGFEMSIRYHNRKKLENVEYEYFPSILELAKNSDWLVLSCPGGKSTEHIVNGNVFESLGPNGYIVNVARGSVINTTDLISALRNKQIAGAALDVIEGEPNFPEEIKKCSNVVLTPHTGGKSIESSAAMLAQVIANLDAHFAGRAVLTPVI